MNDEEHGEDHDDTGTERDSETGTTSGGVDAVRADESGSPDEESNRDIDARPNSDIETQNNSEIANHDLTQMIAALMRMGVSESYSGMLPKPDDFNKYPVEVQERMCRWNDAFTTDESKRQDRLVDAEIKQARDGLLVSLVLFLVTIFCALVTFLATGSSWSFGFLTVPVVSMIVSLFEPVSSRSSRNRSEQNQLKNTSDKDAEKQSTD